MLTGRSSLLQVHQLYLREIKTKEHLHWRKQVIKTHNMSIANRKFTQRKMYYVSIDTAIFKLINNLTI